MSSLLFIGLCAVALVIWLKNPITDFFEKNTRLIQKLKNTTWFQNHWLSGMFLFFMNAALFISTGLVLYLLGYFVIPYVHLLLMFVAVFASIYLWGFVNKAWQGSKRNRLKMGALGSSFYLILTLMFVYGFVTLKPSYPGEDTFMRGIGLLFAMIVTTVACMTCFIFTGFSKRK